MNDVISHKPTLVRIHEVDFPLSTTDLEQLKSACLVPVYKPGIVAIGGQAARVTAPDGALAQVMVGHTPGLNGGQALIVRETAAALDDLRVQINVLRKGLRVSLQVNEQLAKQAQIGQDGRTSSHLREIEDGVRELRELFFPDDREPSTEDA
jgi:hypothetical protein